MVVGARRPGGEPSSRPIARWWPSVRSILARTAQRIVGDKTGLSGPIGIKTDSKGNMYVANYHLNAITEYAASANGNVAPTATISTWGSTARMAATICLCLST